MRILITGASGFVGGRLCARLGARREAGEALELHGLARGERPPGLDGIAWHRIDLADRAAVVRAVRAIAPERVVHLGAVAEPRACARDPRRAYVVNAGGTAAVLAGLGPGARALLASTAQVYGAPLERPFREEDAAAAESAYGRSKRCAEAVAVRFAERGLAVVVARAFNHGGPGQSTSYVLPALAEQVRAARDEGLPLRTGNLWPRRDFLHVDDVLDAYELLLERGEPGAAYNVCRGETTSIREVLDGLQRRLGTALEPEPDPARVRPGEPAEVAGDPARLAALGWRPAIGMGELLDQVAAAAEGRP